MKLLHFNLYHNGDVGMCNVLMSIENALIIARLTKRDKIIFYGTGKLYITGETTKFTIFDLFDFKFPYELIESDEIPLSVNRLPSGFGDSAFYYKDKPSDDFLNGRNGFDLSEFEHLSEFGTYNNATLAYYSYLFYFKRNRKEMLDYVKDMIRVKDKYISVFTLVYANVKKMASTYNSVSIRRGDYMWVNNAKNKDYDSSYICEQLEANFSKDVLLLVHSDEDDLDFFAPIKSKFKSVLFIQKYIHSIDNSLTRIETGLVSLLVAVMAERFIGTMYSTFTGIIQRYRRQVGQYEDFRFLYSQDDGLELLENKMAERIAFGENTWNRVVMPDVLKRICHWFTEWPECYPQRIHQNESLTINRDFLTEEEINYISELANKDGGYDEWYKRKVNNIYFDSDVVLLGLVKRACDELGYDFRNVEPAMQLFRQDVGGSMTFHCDSIHQNEQGRRIASVLFYINDDYKGGGISFPNLKTEIGITRGAMVKFPIINSYNEQAQSFLHGTHTLTEGIKIIAYISIKEKPRAY